MYSWTWTKVPITFEIVFRWFSFFGSSLSHIKPKLELFEVLELKTLAMMMICRTFISYVCAFCLKNFLTTRPNPSRYPNFFVSTPPVPSRPEVKNPYPSDPARGILRWAGQSWYTEILSHLMKKWKLNDKDTNSCYETQCRVSTYRFQADIYQWSPNLPKTWRK